MRNKKSKNLPVILVLVATAIGLAANLGDTLTVTRDWKDYWSGNAVIMLISIFMLVMVAKVARNGRKESIE